jgi:hypothetical protein
MSNQLKIYLLLKRDLSGKLKLKKGREERSISRKEPFLNESKALSRKELGKAPIFGTGEEI